MASLYQHVPFRQDASYLAIGERTNANGSKAFREAMLAQRWKLPETLVMPIKYHDRPTAAPAEQKSLRIRLFPGADAVFERTSKADAHGGGAIWSGDAGAGEGESGRGGEDAVMVAHQSAGR